jgi:hypothetical protein
MTLVVKSDTNESPMHLKNAVFWDVATCGFIIFKSRLHRAGHLLTYTLPPPPQGSHPAPSVPPNCS